MQLVDMRPFVPKRMHIETEATTKSIHLNVNIII